MMVLKIRVSVPLSNSRKQRILKWRRNRGVIWLRPPPGGPIAPITTVSIIVCHVISFRLYLFAGNIVDQNCYALVLQN